MNTPLEMQSVTDCVPHCMTAKDICEVFTSEMHSLYLLSYLLTADEARAEQCLLAVLGKGVEEIGNFLEWARVPARIAILRHAIQMIRPTSVGMARQSTAVLNWPARPDRNKPFAAIASLGSFERCVFVMSVLEGRSDEECTALLDCTRLDVVMGRELAQQVLAAAELEFDQLQETWYPSMASSLPRQRFGTC
jgi:hypothetical protein